MLQIVMQLPTSAELSCEPFATSIIYLFIYFFLSELFHRQSKACIMCFYKSFDVCLVWFSLGVHRRGSKNHPIPCYLKKMRSRKEMCKHVKTLVKPWILLLEYFDGGKGGLWFIWIKTASLASFGVTFGNISFWNINHVITFFMNMKG